MVLEATMLCLDSSEWMRNGDFEPSRLRAQEDAVGFLANSKLNQNPENVVGLMSSGDRIKVISTLSSDIGRILSGSQNLELAGSMNIVTSIQIAQLALKHRQNKNQRQRIIVFVGSPLLATEQELVKCGKKLKKNNVSVDIINFGEEAENTIKLEAFISAVNNKEGTSHLVTVPAGPHVLSDILVSSPIIGGEEGGAGGAAAPGGGFEFGVDPSLDPELALALRVSMEEEKQRQERLAKEKEAAGGGEESKAGEEPAKASEEGAVKMEEDGDLLAKAIAMSMETGGGDAMQGVEGPSSGAGGREMTEEEQIAMALQMSMQQDGDESSEKQDFSKVMNDPEFLNSVLGSLPGVDPNNESIQSTLSNLKDDKDKEKKGEDESKK
eukprot:Nk52_evm4s96 gene=Nk52_evmTU4s96